MFAFLVCNAAPVVVVVFLRLSISPSNPCRITDGVAAAVAVQSNLPTHPSSYLFISWPD